MYSKRYQIVALPLLLLHIAGIATGFLSLTSWRATRWQELSQQDRPPSFVHGTRRPDTVVVSGTTGQTENDINEVPKVQGVTLKLALDSNGAVADLSEEKSGRFTCEASLDMVHRLRACSDAVLVGKGTVQVDDCSLTVRRVPFRTKQPTRVVLDSRLSLVLSQLNEGARYQIFHDGHDTILYHSLKDVDVASLNLLETVQCVYLDESNDNPSHMKLSPRAILQDLSFRGMHHVMLEGGPETARAFLNQSAIDRAILVHAPLCFRLPLASNITKETLEMAGLQLLGSTNSGVDRLECWSRPHLPWPTDDLGSWP